MVVTLRVTAISLMYDGSKLSIVTNLGAQNQKMLLFSMPNLKASQLERIYPETECGIDEHWLWIIFAHYMEDASSFIDSTITMVG
ncbi:MAG: hypothetical protein IPJ13_31870 [Saprospiraceae bacterium]|nr:hypothetical protein [Saprospiraceae bacterium]